MPNCFQLINRESGKAEAFNHIDNELCRYVGVAADDNRYYMDRYNIAGFQIALGEDLESQIKKGEEWILANPTDDHAIDFLAVLRWLHEHYSTEAWVERK